MLSKVSGAILGAVEVTPRAKLPSRTYRIHGGRVMGTVDGIEAMEQAVKKALETERFAYLIYSWSYGTEWNALIGKSRAVVESEARRLMDEALGQDERVLSVGEVAISPVGRDGAKVTVTVETIFGTVREETTIHV